MAGWLAGGLVQVVLVVYFCGFYYSMNMKESGYYLQLNDVPGYKRAFHLSNYIWNIVMEWEWFAKKTIGCQFVDAGDSISANIAEGFGRYH